MRGSPNRWERPRGLFVSLEVVSAVHVDARVSLSKAADLAGKIIVRDGFGFLPGSIASGLPSQHRMQHSNPIADARIPRAVDDLCPIHVLEENPACAPLGFPGMDFEGFNDVFREAGVHFDHPLESTWREKCMGQCVGVGGAAEYQTAGRCQCSIDQFEEEIHDRADWEFRCTRTHIMGL